MVPQASWNTWTERDGKEVRHLEPGQRYEVALDISRYAYIQQQSAPADKGVNDIIQLALERSERHVVLTIRPMLIGEALDRAPGFKPENELLIRTDQLRPPAADAAEREAVLLQKLGRGETSLVAVSSQLQAGIVKVPIRATHKTGCAQVVFSIWDESGHRPLDYVVHTVSVRSGSVAAPECETNASVQGGFRSLSGIISATADSQIDAALQIMEFDSHDSAPRTVAMFLDVEAHKAARADRTLNNRGMYAWTLRTTLADYVGDKKQLLTLINAARDTGSYTEAAQELKKRLFPPGTDNDEKEAGAAFSALTKLTKRLQRSPVILVRARTARNSSVFVPLGLLAAHGAKLLDKPLVVMHPMPRERFATPGACIDRWALGVPIKLDGVDGEIPVSLSSRMTRYGTLPALKKYLSPEPAPRGGSGEGLVVLAHQDAGNIWFTGEGAQGRLTVEDYNRRFPPGSLAVLGSCSASNPKGDNQAVLEWLNRSGIDVIVASPFPIEASYGVELVRGFIDSAGKAHKAKKTPTVLELFQSATSQAAKRLGAQAALQEKALEFVIIGDHGMRLCKH